MAVRRFEVTVTQTVEIDDAVFAEVAEGDWRTTFYDLPDDDAVAAHVGREPDPRVVVQAARRVRAAARRRCEDLREGRLGRRSE